MQRATDSTQHATENVQRATGSTQPNIYAGRARPHSQQVLEDAALLDALLDALQILAHALTSERIFACTCADCVHLQ
jgi:hypothetical protein